jgi:aerobic-type carbon monoxide dehydrogenase small subunit (CoxS/CutS family)
MPRFEIRVNGALHGIDAEPGDSLLTILHDDLGFTGTKYGCGEGQCGACTVLLDGQAVRSCVTRIGTVGTRSVTTIEGLAAGGTLHPVQAAFLEVEAFQCGYCTAGMVMATVGLLKNAPNPSDADVARLLDRNVCRCGTYPRIIQAVRLAARRLATPSDGGAR